MLDFLQKKVFNVYMKKFLCAFILLISLFTFARGEVSFAQESPVFVVVANNANVFAEANLNSEILISLPHGTEFSAGGEYNLEFSSSSPAEYKNGSTTFYKVLLPENEGYILAEFVSAKNDVVESIPNFNAKTNDSCKVYCSDGTELTLEKGHRIYLYEKYNRRASRTNIMFLHDNKIVYGQIDTKFVDPDGVNPILISAIIIIIAVLGIIFAWLFMKNKKKKVKMKKI